ncbi:MAG: hypothetical protein PF447_02125 [Spirochaetaceae bacterium]|jgi:2-isopropylmalate synthase|nr:hypothetical protein [Spirochaetaceae bacterium]
MKIKQIKINDTTLREGLQSPGITLNTVQRIHLAKNLEDLGVDNLEAGIPFPTAVAAGRSDQIFL